MDDFQGPFCFKIDTRGTLKPWASMDPEVLKKLDKKSRALKNSSNIYFFGISIQQTDVGKEKHHNWLEISRIFVSVKPDNKLIEIIGISPGDIRPHEAIKGQHAFVFERKEKLFNMRNQRLDNVSFKVNSLARKDQFAVLAAFTKREAQWVYTKAWKEKKYEMCICMTVPVGAIKKGAKAIYVSIKPARKKNQVLTKASVFKHEVVLY